MEEDSSEKTLYEPKLPSAFKMLRETFWLGAEKQKAEKQAKNK